MRRIIFSFLHWSGLMWLRRFLNRNEVTIVTIHGVMDADDHPSWVPLRPQLPRRRLEECLRVLSRYYRFVTLQDAVDMLTGRTPVRPYSLVLTFDDGYRNNVKHALPILRRYRVPATLFLVAGHVEHRKPFWFDRLDYALQHAAVDGRQVRIGDATIRFSATSREALRTSYKHLRDVAKARHRNDADLFREVEELSTVLERESGRRLTDIFEEDDWSAVLTWEDIREAAGEYVAFGSHTVDHLRLGLAEADVIADQLTRSKHMIEARTGLPCRHLCYPNGSFNREVVEIARACGYTSGVTTVLGFNRVGSDPMALRRVSLPESGSMAEMLGHVCGLSISRFRERVRRALRG